MRLLVQVATLFACMASVAIGQEQTAWNENSLKITRLPPTTPNHTTGETLQSKPDTILIESDFETLEFAWNLAIASNPALQGMHAGRTAAEFGLRGARAERMPTLQVMGGATISDSDRSIVTRTTGPSPVLIPYQPQDQAVGGLFGSIPIYQGGKIDSMIQAADRQLAASTWSLDAMHQELKLLVAHDYLEVLRAEANHSAFQTAYAAAEEARLVAESQLAQGQIDEAGRLQVAADHATARFNVEAAALSVQHARQIYNSRLGRFDGADKPLQPLHLRLAGTDYEAQINGALLGHPELQRLLAEAEALEFQARSRRAETRPQVNAGGGLLSDSNPFQAPSDLAIGYVSVSWKLYDGARSDHRYQELLHQAAAKRHEHAQRSEDIKRQTWLASYQLKVAEKKLVALQAIQRAAQETHAQTVHLQAQGQITLEQVLASRSSLANAELQVQLAYLDVVESELRLLRELNQL